MDKAYSRISIIVLILLLVACAPSASQIQTAVAKTQAILPTKTETNTPEPTLTITPTLIPASYIASVFVKFHWEPCWKMGFNIDDGVFDDGVTYECLYEPNYINIVLVGYDGTLRFIAGGYKAPSFNTLDHNQIIGDIFGSDVFAWVNDSFSRAEAGKQGGTVGAFHLTLYLAQEKDAFPGGWGTGIDLVLEIVPFGAESHLSN